MLGSLYGDVRTKRQRYESLSAALWTERSSFDSHWKEIADFMQPRRARFTVTDRNRGDKRNSNIIDSTAKMAARTLSSGLHAGLTSPARPWMKLTTPDPELAKFGPVKEWLHDVTMRMLTIFAQTNLYNVLPIIYGDMGLFGTAAMGVLEDSKDLFRVYPYAVGSYAVGLNERGLATTFCRKYQMTVRQVVGQFAADPRTREINWRVISNRTKTLWDQGSYEATVEVMHVTAPNEEADDRRIGSKYLPWTSCYFETGSDSRDEKVFLAERGYNEFPYMVPRWDITDGDSYGTDCPGMTCLGDVKQLQIMQRKKGQAISKMVDPPLVGPAALMATKTSLLPGDVTYLDEGQGPNRLRSIHDVNLRLDHLAADIDQVQYRIQRAFYEDLFLMLARSDGSRGAAPVTAREVEERHEEKLLALGPVLERTNDELLDPMVDRVYNLMDRAGLIPPPPDQLDGVSIKAEYISILAQAQKLVGVVGLDRFMQSSMAMIQFFPGIGNKINTNMVMDGYGDMLGIDPRVVRTNEEADEIAAEQQAQQQQAAEIEQAKVMASAVKDAGTTPMEGDTALSRVVGNAAVA